MDPFHTLAGGCLYETGGGPGRDCTDDIIDIPLDVFKITVNLEPFNFTTFGIYRIDGSLEPVFEKTVEENPGLMDGL